MLSCPWPTCQIIGRFRLHALLPPLQARCEHAAHQHSCLSPPPDLPAPAATASCDKSPFRNVSVALLSHRSIQASFWNSICDATSDPVTFYFRLYLQVSPFSPLIPPSHLTSQPSRTFSTSSLTALLTPHAPGRPELLSD